MAKPGQMIGDAILAELRRPVSGAVMAVAEEIRRRHGAAVAACLFYGSCLWAGRDEGRIIDLYVLVDDYRIFHRTRLPAILNALLPPNVYYLETGFEGRVARTKYAVVSLEDLTRGTSAAAFQSTLWGRLAQPCALVYARDPRIEQRVLASLASSLEMLALQTLPLMPAEFTPQQLWTRAFAESYRTEMRAERTTRPFELYRVNAGRYEQLTAAVLEGAGGATVDATMSRSEPGVIRHEASVARHRAARLRWWARRVAGTGLHLLRLLKAAYTFRGGLDYILWKIEQHSGIRTEPTPWQRRHPIMAAPGLAWRLYRQGAFR